MERYSGEDLNINLLCISWIINVSQLLTRQAGCAHDIKSVENVEDQQRDQKSGGIQRLSPPNFPAIWTKLLNSLFGF